MKKQKGIQTPWEPESGSFTKQADPLAMCRRHCKYHIADKINEQGQVLKLLLCQSLINKLGLRRTVAAILFHAGAKLTAGAVSELIENYLGATHS